MPFEEFGQKRGKGRYSFPVVTIMRSGGIGINRQAVEALGDPERVVLAYDREERLVGLRGARNNEKERSYSIHKSSDEAMWISGQGFMRYYDIDRQSTLRYRAALQGEYLVVDLKAKPLNEPKRRLGAGKGGDDGTD